MNAGKYVSLIVLLSGLATWLLFGRNEAKEKTATEKPDHPTVQKEAVAADRQLLTTALQSPESLDESPVACLNEPSGVPGNAASVPAPASAVTAQRSELLSSAQKPLLPQPAKEPIAAENLYFWKSYQSLRKDEIRNPGSAENRAGVVSLMQMRQRRAKQNVF